jgi:hypothetical protein
MGGGGELLRDQTQPSQAKLGRWRQRKGEQKRERRRASRALCGVLLAGGRVLRGCVLRPCIVVYLSLMFCSRRHCFRASLDCCHLCRAVCHLPAVCCFGPPSVGVCGHADRAAFQRSHTPHAAHAQPTDTTEGQRGHAIFCPDGYDDAPIVIDKTPNVHVRPQLPATPAIPGVRPKFHPPARPVSPLKALSIL